MGKAAGRRGGSNPDKADKDGAVDSGASGKGGTGKVTPSGDRGAIGDGAGGYPPPEPPKK